MNLPAPSARPPRAAASVVIVRDGAAGLELLLLRRAEKGDHNSGAWVFPGGLLEAADREAHALCAGLDDAAASRRLSLPQAGLDYWVAAIRECFEECGVLFAVDAAGAMPKLPDAVALRQALHGGRIGLHELCASHGLRLAAGSLSYIGHWITPVGRAKRFDVRFFVAALPAGQVSEPDAGELTEQVWIRPAEALAGDHAMRLMSPTRAMIESIAPFGDTAALAAWAARPRSVPCILPRLARDDSGLNPVHPDHPAWAEIGRLDPEGTGQAWRDLPPGRTTRLSPRLLRLTLAGGAQAYRVDGDDGASSWIDAGEDAGDDGDDALASAVAEAAAHVTRVLTLSSAPTAHRRAERLAGALGAAFEDPPSTTSALQRIEAADGHAALWWPAEATLFSGDLPREVALQIARERGARWIAPARGFLVAVDGA